jgi:hypothetical protein
MGQNAGQFLIMRDQQAAGTGTHENLDTRRAGNAFQLGQIRRIGRCRADIECVVTPHAMVRALQLVMHAHHRSVLGLVLGISNTAVIPPITAQRLPLSRSSLYSSPGSRKWTCRSIAGQYIQSGAINPARRIGKTADADDFAITDGNINLRAARGSVDSATGEDKVWCLGHVLRFATGWGQDEGLDARDCLRRAMSSAAGVGRSL